MLIDTMKIKNLMPESPYVAMHKEVFIDFNHSQVFYFLEEINMSKSNFRRLKGPLCACGCGQRVKQDRKQWNKFINGHNARINNPMDNPKYRAKIQGKNNPMYGKIRSKEFRETQSKRMKENPPMRRPEVAAKITGVNHPNYGKDKYSKEKAKEAPLCACGCKEKVKWGSSKWNKYINGHRHRTKNFFIKKPSDIEAPYCQCGCKEKTKWGHSQKKWNKYIHAHHFIGGNSGANNPMYGRVGILASMYGRKGKDSPTYGKCGPLAPGWRGGKSFEPYCEIWIDKEYKQSIKDRDNNECQNPDCWGAAKRLGIHHIDHVKKNCHPWNLITLCASCNSRANYNRKYWSELYQDIMLKKYGYHHENSKQTKSGAK